MLSRCICCVIGVVSAVLFGPLALTTVEIKADPRLDSPTEVERHTTGVLTPRLSILPDFGNVGDQLTLAGSGFAPNEFMIFRADGVVLFVYQTGWDGRMQVISDQFGAFGNPTMALGSALTPSVRFTVPSLVGGEHSISAEDESGHVASAVLKVTAKINITPLIGPTGAQIRAYGTGMRFEVPLKITLGTTLLSEHSLVTDAGGFFDTAITIPDTHKGIYIITVDDGFDKTEFSFIVEGQPPYTPKLQLPKSKSTIHSQSKFKWSSVDDPSGVTYELQVSAEPDFGRLLLDKKDLDSPEYVLTEAEKTRLSGGGDEFYWRVRAIDGVGIGGEWSSTGFYHTGVSRAILVALTGIPIILAVVTTAVFLLRKKLTGRR
jgi:hypothetical protein